MLSISYTDKYKKYNTAANKHNKHRQAEKSLAIENMQMPTS